MENFFSPRVFSNLDVGVSAVWIFWVFIYLRILKIHDFDFESDTRTTKLYWIKYFFSQVYYWFWCQHRHFHFILKSQMAGTKRLVLHGFYAILRCIVDFSWQNRFGQKLDQKSKIWRFWALLSSFFWILFNFFLQIVL